MKINRKKNAVRNIAFGFILRIIKTIIPFVIRTVLLYQMGIKYLGFDSLFVAILQVLNLAELGVGTAMVFSMYQPIAEDDHQKICALMRLYKMYYRYIGLIIGAVGIALTPVIPRLVNSELPPELNLYVLYYLNLAATVLTYWLFAYKNSLLMAHQRNDIVSKISIIAFSVQYGLQILVIVLFHNYYIYVMVMLATQVLNNIMTALVVDRIYPQYRAEGQLDGESRKIINGKIRDLFLNKFGGAVLTSADSIVISSFLSLELLAIYQNYYLLLTAVFGFLEILMTSITAGIGNSFVVESEEKNFNDFFKISFMYIWILNICVNCFLAMYQPFMSLWAGEKNLLPYGVVICFGLFFLAYEFTRLFNEFKNAAGIWHEDRFRPLVSAIVNLFLNVMSVHYIGIYGIILSSVVALGLIEVPWLLQNVFTYLYPKRYAKEYIGYMISYLAAIGVSMFLTGYLTMHFRSGSVLNLLVCLGISMLSSNLVFFVCYRKTKQFSETMQLGEYVAGKILKFQKS